MMPQNAMSGKTRRQPLFGKIQVSGHQRGLCAIGSAQSGGRFSQPGLRRLFGAREGSAKEIDVLEIVGAALWIRPQCLLVGCTCFAQPSNMQTNPGHPAMGPVK